MQHSIIYKQKDRYASFPLLTKIGNQIHIGFFTAPIPDHMGIFNWRILKSTDQGNTWKNNYNRFHSYTWPSVSPREISDRFAYQLDKKKIVTGAYGFRKQGDWFGGIKKIYKSKSIFIRSSDDNWKTINEKIYEIPHVDIVCTFPRPLIPRNEYDWIRLIPVYVVLKNGLNRALAWQSSDFGKTWQLYNMFPSEVNANEIAFVWASNDRILAHIRSDKHPYIMESWSEDNGKTWTYPTNIYANKNDPSPEGSNVIGGPVHLLGLNDGRILCTYGYRQEPMGIRATVSDDGGNTWGMPIILRSDGGYRSSLHKKKWFWQEKAHPGNDIGYPVSIQLDNDEILTAYYITTKDQITSIQITKWRII